MATDEGRDPEGLIGDPQRQASDAARGYSYQFWRTVRAWIDLEPEEWLYVEGAEDFDRVTHFEGTATQVKDNKASGALTLGSSKAVETLNNFWRTKKGNQDRKIQFQYVTTAGIGLESGGDPKEKGIEAWEICRELPAEECADRVEKIRTFLVTKDSLDPDLRSFLETTGIEEIHRDLISRVAWQYDQPSLESTKEEVKARLLDVGKTHGLTSRDADTLAAKLYGKVEKAAITRPSAPLTFVTFIKLLDRAANVEIPRAALYKTPGLLRGISHILTRTRDGQEGTDLPTISEESEGFAPPVLPSNVWPRRALIDRLRSAMEHGVVSVCGSTGMGKTILVHHSVYEFDNPVLWASVRGRKAREVGATAKRLAERLRQDVTPCIVVLDDLNPTDDPRDLEVGLGRLAWAIRQAGGHMVIVSYQPLGPRLASIVGLAEDRRIEVPPFDEAEVTGLLVSQGCTSADAPALARFVGVLTSGHPQLVAARINGLKGDGFPKPKFDELLDQPKDIKQVTAEVQGVVRAVLPSNARELLYRLSLVYRPIRRELALRISELEEPIPNAGEAFDQLVGPWVEQLTEDRFKVSALVSSIGKQMLSPETIKLFHGRIANAILSERSLTVDDFGGVLVHGVLGAAEDVILVASKVFLTESNDIKSALAREVPWVAGMGISPGTELPFSNPGACQFFRLLQWDVLSITSPRKLEALYERIQEEFPRAGTAIAEIAPRILFLFKVLLDWQFSMSPNLLISNALELWHYLDLAKEAGTPLPGSEAPPMISGIDRPPMSDLFSAALIPRIRTPEDLAVLTAALDELEIAERNKLLSGFQTDDGELRILFQQPWVYIKGESDQDYDHYANVLNETIIAGRRWNHIPWIQAATRVLAAIVDEILEQGSEAESLIAKNLEEYGSSHSLQDGLAVIYYNSKRYVEALEIWDRILPVWNVDATTSDSQPVFSCRNAAIASASLGAWGRAAEWFEQAFSRGSRFGTRPSTIGILADWGYALWQSENRIAALDRFSQAVENLEKLPNRPDTFAEYAVHKLVGATMTYLVSPDASGEPIPGMCSNLSPHEGIKDLPTTPIEFSWHMVYQLADMIGANGIADRATEKIQNAPNAFLRSRAASHHFHRCLTENDVIGAFPHAVGMALDFARAQERIETPINEPDPPELQLLYPETNTVGFLRVGLRALLIKGNDLGRNAIELVDNWRKSIPVELPFIVQELDILVSIIEKTAGERGSIMMDPNAASERRAIAAISLLGGNATPNDVLYAEATLVTEAKQFDHISRAVAESFCRLVAKDWLRIIDSPFHLQSPRLFRDAIKDACEAVDGSWASSAKVILAALPATRIRVSSDLIATLEGIAKGGI